MTWSVLLARWVEFARSAVALPSDEEGRLLRDSVPDLIMLQAVWFALHHVDDLPADERPLALDRARVLVDKHGQKLQQTWAGRVPAAALELLRGTQEQLARAAGKHL